MIRISLKIDLTKKLLFCSEVVVNGYNKGILLKKQFTSGNFVENF